MTITETTGTTTQTDAHVAHQEVRTMLSMEECRSDRQIEGSWNIPTCVGDLENEVMEHCEGRDVSPQHQKMMLAALLAIFEWEPFAEAINSIVYTQMQEIMEAVEHCSLENPDPEENIYFEYEDLFDHVTLPEMIKWASSYLPKVSNQPLPASS